MINNDTQFYYEVTMFINKYVYVHVGRYKIVIYQVQGFLL